MANMHLVTGYAGEAHITAADQASLLAGLFGRFEYVLYHGSRFAATVQGNQVTIADGDLLMFGRHVRLTEPVTLTIESGAQGYNRTDVIAVRYTKDASTDVEECNLVVIQGEPTTGTPKTPEWSSNNLIDESATVAEMGLYRIRLSGLTVGEPEPIFDAPVPLWYGGSVSGRMIADYSVAAHMLDSGSVTSAKIADGAVTSGKLASNSVTSAKLADSSVTSAKLSGTVPVSKGGTGATAKAAARKNLGITSGTSAPSGGSSGDIYFQII